MMDLNGFQSSMPMYTPASLGILTPDIMAMQNPAYMNALAFGSSIAGQVLTAGSVPPVQTLFQTVQSLQQQTQQLQQMLASFGVSPQAMFPTQANFLGVPGADMSATMPGMGPISSPVAAAQGAMNQVAQAATAGLPSMGLGGNPQMGQNPQAQAMGGGGMPPQMGQNPQAGAAAGRGADPAADMSQNPQALMAAMQGQAGQSGVSGLGGDTGMSDKDALMAALEAKGGGGKASLPKGRGGATAAASATGEEELSPELLQAIAQKTGKNPAALLDLIKKQGLKKTAQQDEEGTGINELLKSAEAQKPAKMDPERSKKLMEKLIPIAKKNPEKILSLFSFLQKLLPEEFLIDLLVEALTSTTEVSGQGGGGSPSSPKPAPAPAPAAAAAAAAAKPATTAVDGKGGATGADAAATKADLAKMAEAFAKAAQPKDLSITDKDLIAKALDNSGVIAKAAIEKLSVGGSSTAKVEPVATPVAGKGSEPPVKPAEPAKAVAAGDTAGKGIGLAKPEPAKAEPAVSTGAASGRGGSAPIITSSDVIMNDLKDLKAVVNNILGIVREDLTVDKDTKAIAKEDLAVDQKDLAVDLADAKAEQVTTETTTTAAASSVTEPAAAAAPPATADAPAPAEAPAAA